MLKLVGLLVTPKPRDLDIITVPIPQINDDQVLIKGMIEACSGSSLTLFTRLLFFSQ